MTLKPRTPLNGYDETIAGTRLQEVTGMALVAIATPRGGADGLNAATNAAWGIAMPAAGSTAASSDGTVRLLGLQPDQVFALFPFAGDGAVGEVRKHLGDSGYYTDQSDSWAILRLSGIAALPALERICPLDLDEAAFSINKVARTVMEHLGTVILREGTDTFLLMSARSSAGNFCHAIEQSLHNVA